jgi:hypothetical protein
MGHGHALLALDALITKSYLNADAGAYRRLRDAIDQQTLGQSLQQMRERLPLAGDPDSLFRAALKTRNRPGPSLIFETSMRDGSMTAAATRWSPIFAT